MYPNNSGSMNAYAALGNQAGVQSATPKETLADQFGYEINAILEMAGEVNRAADRIYGHQPADGKAEGSQIQPISASLIAKLNDLQRARALLRSAVERLTSGL